MSMANPAADQRIAQAVVAFQHQRTGHASVAVVLRDEARVVARAPAENRRAVAARMLARMAGKKASRSDSP
jgi:hypothetical protein